MLSIAYVLLAGLGHADNSSDVIDTFWSYGAAAVDSDGEAVVRKFSKSSFDYSKERILDARELNKKELLKRPVYQAFSVVLIRERAKLDPGILDMDGRTWLSYGYSKGWNSHKALDTVTENKELFEPIVDVEGKTAELRLKYDGKIIPTAFPFVKEDGVWKINGKLQFERLEKNFETRWKDSGKTKEEYCDLLFMVLFRKAIDESLWRPAKGG